MNFCWVWENGCTIYDTTSIAAWIQALGSIGAIIGAFFVAHKQGEKQLAIAREQSEAQINALKEQSKNQHESAMTVIEEQRRLDLERRFHICFALYSSITSLYTTLLTHRTENVETLSFSLESINVLKRTIENIPPFEYPSGVAYIYFSHLGKFLDLLAEGFSREVPNSKIITVHISKIDNPNSELGKLIRDHLHYITEEYAEVEADRNELTATEAS